jgi:hypothetical protein
MTDIKTDLGRDALEHFGVLGMKWGHRKEDPSSGKTGRKADKAWKRDGVKPLDGYIQTVLASKAFREKAASINASMPGKTLGDRDYRNAHRQLLQDLADYVGPQYRSPSGDQYWDLTATLSPNGNFSFMGKPKPVTSGMGEPTDKPFSVSHSNTQEAVVLCSGKAIVNESGQVVDYGDLKLENSELMMSSSDTEDFLAHYGVLGMRWGYRKDELAIAKADAKFERKAVTKGLSRRKYVRAVNRAIKGFNKDIHDINKSPTFRNKDLTNKNDPVTRQYFELVQKTFEDHLAAASRKLPTNYSGTRQFRLNPSFDNRWPTVSVVDISASPADVDAQHSSVSDSNDTAPPAPMPLKAIFDQLGKVVRIEEMVEEPIVMHSEEVGQEFIEHFGVLGMRWGYRKADNILAPKPEAPKEPKKLGPIQKHELNQLSNDEVKQVIERINLEKQLREVMTEPAKPKGQSWIQQNAGPLATKAAITAATTATSLAIKWYFDGKKDKAKAATKAAEKAREIILTTQAEIDAKAMRDAAKAARKAAKAASQATVII